MVLNMVTLSPFCVWTGIWNSPQHGMIWEDPMIFLLSQLLLKIFTTWYINTFPMHSAMAVLAAAAAAAKLLQSCPTLCDPIDGSPSGSSVPGILQARTLEWVAISFSKAWKWKVKVKSLSHVRLFKTSWTAAYQAPPSMGFSRKSTGVGCHCLLSSIHDYWKKHSLD